jgi:hypothetical protein
MPVAAAADFATSSRTYTRKRQAHHTHARVLVPLVSRIAPVPVICHLQPTESIQIQAITDREFAPFPWKTQQTVY